MNKQAAINLIADTFNSSFNEDRFRHFIRNLFNELDENKNASWITGYIKDSFKDHVKKYKRIGKYKDKEGNKLVNLLCQGSAARGNNFCASIHKAKGLEAESVRVVAKNKNELKKWLTTDYEDRYKDKNDTCRIGYVGFTRAKQILCIACNKTIDDPIRTKLKELGVEIVG